LRSAQFRELFRRQAFTAPRVDLGLADPPVQGGFGDPHLFSDLPLGDLAPQRQRDDLSSELGRIGFVHGDILP
jgi:hypothetical protein